MSTQSIKPNKEGSAETKKTKPDNSVTSLRRTFRSYASSLSLAARAASKLVEEAPGKATDVKETQKNFKDGVKHTLLLRQSLREKSALLEGKLRGNAKESQALHCMLRSQPCVSGVKRKFSIADDEEKG
eukprot:scaffold35611_cov32-Cyclotella_meneghiniana.AAC.1